MADEIKVIAGLEVSNPDNNFVLPKFGGRVQNFDQDIPGGGVPGMMDCVDTGQGTTIPTTGLTSPGWCYLRNLDLENFVEFGPLVAAVLHPFGELGPGEEAVFKLTLGAVMNIRADTAPCQVQVVIIER